MQTALTQRTVLAGAPVRTAATTNVRSRSTLVARASAENVENRRAVLGGVLAAGLALAGKAQAMELFDDRKAKDTGYDLIYQARDLDLPQGTRDGLDQVKGDPSLARNGIKESESRIDNKLPFLVKKEYWTAAREELRLQLGTLRFDINTLISQKPKGSRKELEALKKAFYAKTDELDFALRKKSPEDANSLLAEVQSNLDKVVSALV